MLDWKLKAWFFDKHTVLARVARGVAKPLSKFGAFVRRSAKSSIRTRKRASKPGQPPSSHVGLLRRFIFFAYEPQSRTVVIGPVGFRNSRAPRVLEKGGTAVIVDSGWRTTRVGVKKRTESRRTIRIAPRPYMAPALKINRPQLPRLLKNSVK